MKRAFFHVALLGLVIFGIGISNSQATSTPTVAQYLALQKQVISLNSKVDLLSARIGSLESSASSNSELVRKTSSIESKLSSLASWQSNLSAYHPSDIYFYSLGTCQLPADLVTTIPIPGSILCHVRVLATEWHP